jgi:hypothetical protein
MAAGNGNRATSVARLHLKGPVLTCIHPRRMLLILTFGSITSVMVH